MEYVMSLQPILLAVGGAGGCAAIGNPFDGAVHLEPAPFQRLFAENMADLPSPSTGP